MGTYDELAKLNTESPIPMPRIAETIAGETRSDTEGNKTSIPEKKHSSKQENIQSNKHVYMQLFLDRKSSATATFRLSPVLIDKLDEIQYLAKKNHGLKLTKYDLVTAALAFLFWDFEANGKASLVYEILKN